MIHQVSSSVLQSSRKHKGPTTSYLSKLVDNNQCFNNWGGKKSLGTWSCVLNTHLQHQSSQNCSVQQRRNLNRSQNDLQMRTWCYTRPCGAETEYWDCNQDEFLHKWTSNTTTIALWCNWFILFDQHQWFMPYVNMFGFLYFLIPLLILMYLF